MLSSSMWWVSGLIFSFLPSSRFTLQWLCLHPGPYSSCTPESQHSSPSLLSPFRFCLPIAVGVWMPNRLFAVCPTCQDVIPYQPIFQTCTQEACPAVMFPSSCQIITQNGGKSACKKGSCLSNTIPISLTLRLRFKFYSVKCLSRSAIDEWRIKPSTFGKYTPI